jgi:hypothetical protein
MKRYAGVTWNEPRDDGEWVKYADAEAEIGKAYLRGLHSARETADKLVKRDREEIASMFADWLETDKVSTESFLSRILFRGSDSRGEVPLCTCDWSPQLDGHREGCPCRKKPVKIAKLDYSYWYDWQKTLRDTVNELIDAENKRRE